MPQQQQEQRVPVSKPPDQLDQQVPTYLVELRFCNTEARKAKEQLKDVCHDLSKWILHIQWLAIPQVVGNYEIINIQNSFQKRKSQETPIHKSFLQL